MTIESIKPESGEGQWKIRLSDGSFFSFKICYLPSTPDIAEGREINSNEEDAFRFASACLRAEKAALQLIARAEQNTFGLSRKLEKRGHTSACVRAVISQLCETGILDDSRYTRLWLESKVARQTSSPRRLLAALLNRGIDRHDADVVMRTVLDDETEQRLLERYVQRHIQKNSDNAADTDRSLRYTLKSEGFSSIAIRAFFENL